MLHNWLLLLLVCSYLNVFCIGVSHAPAGKRILGMVLAFDNSRLEALRRSLENYVFMCEAGWDPTVVIYTTIYYSAEELRRLNYMTYCYRTGSSLPLRFSLHDPSIRFDLAGVHRYTLYAEQDNFDLFVYHEDDMIITLQHVVAYTMETALLEKRFGSNFTSTHSIGFIRIQREPSPSVIGSEVLCEIPRFMRVSIPSPFDRVEYPYVQLRIQVHQAMWMLTRSQVKGLQTRCGFMNQTNPGRLHRFDTFSMHRYFCSLLLK